MPASGPLDRVRDICSELPDVTEKVAWGAPTFRVRGKMFAMFVNNHHGDGRIALWCNAPLGFQETMTGTFPRRFFVPPYVGPKGWVGLRLDVDVDWVEVAMVLEEAHRKTAPRRTSKRPSERKPKASVEGLVTPDTVRKLALQIPDVGEGTSYGTPAWRAAGKLIARMLDDPDTVVLRTDYAQRDKLMTRDPKTYFTTDHYRNYPWIIVRLSRVSPAQLRRLLEDAREASTLALPRGRRQSSGGTGVTARARSRARRSSR